MTELYNTLPKNRFGLASLTPKELLHSKEQVEQLESIVHKFLANVMEKRMNDVANGTYVPRNFSYEEDNDREVDELVSQFVSPDSLWVFRNLFERKYSCPVLVLAYNDLSVYITYEPPLFPWGKATAYIVNVFYTPRKEKDGEKDKVYKIPITSSQLNHQVVGEELRKFVIESYNFFNQSRLESYNKEYKSVAKRILERLLTAVHTK